MFNSSKQASFLSAVSKTKPLDQVGEDGFLETDTEVRASGGSFCPQAEGHWTVRRSLPHTAPAATNLSVGMTLAQHSTVSTVERKESHYFLLTEIY